jgi:hypothetical protein
MILQKAKERKETNMIRKIGRVTYDTETATLILKKTQGCYGDPAGYEESLYRTPAGHYFVYTNGGEQSPYPTEGIKRLKAEDAEKLIAENA